MTTRTSTRKQSKTDPYMNLVRRFPLKPIRDDKMHAEAVEIIGKLMGRDLDSGTGDYLDTLILLANKYEDENHTPGGLHLSPQMALKAIMTANNLSQAQMG